MGRFTNFFNSIENLRGKGYVGVMHGNLPKSGQVWDGQDFLAANEISLYVNRAISKRSDKVSEIEFVLHDAKGNAIENDPTLDLLYKPNSVFTGRQFWALYQKYIDLCGEAYIYLERSNGFGEKSKVTAMHLLIPTLVNPEFTSDGKIQQFIYKPGSETTTYRPEDILYIFNPDPKKPLRGVSLLKAGVNAIQTETQIETYHSRILQNGGKVEGIFKFKMPSLTREQVQDAKDTYQKEYAGAKKSGMPLFLGGDAEYIRTGLNPEELAFLEAKKMTLEDICILTGVPKSMMASTNDVKFDNADADRAIFLRETIRPLLVNLTTALDEVLFPDGRNLTFVDPTPENADQKLKETESGIKSYYLTINEARERYGLDPVDDGDTILVPFNLTPLGAAPEVVASKKLKAAKAHPLADEGMRRVYWGMQMKRLDRREQTFKKELTKYFNGQAERLVDAVQPASLRYFRKAQVDELLQIAIEVKIGKEALTPVLTHLLREAGHEAMELVGSDYEFNLNAEIASWLDLRTDVFLRQINETTFTKLKDQFAASLAAEEGREALVRRIRDTYQDFNTSRAELIARTEVHNATQYGTLQGYKQGGMTTKIWVAVLDTATRDSHAAADGEERPIDVPFSNGLMFPGDPNGGAGEVINCRCVI